MVKAGKLLFLAVALALALPASASAATFTVNETGDQGDASTADGVCDRDLGTSGDQCTLRAAIDQADAGGVKDTIKFASGVIGSTITPATTLEIDTPVEIKAGDCGDSLVSHRPCVGIHAPATNAFFLDTLADSVVIKGLAIFDSDRGILVDAGASGFKLTNSWLGFQLDVDVDRNNEDLALEGDGATIGGTTGEERNVFAGGLASNSTALHIDGGDANRVRGNYFGVEPDGITGTNPGGDLVELSNGTDGDPVGNVIGASISSAGRATAKCDAGCNVIADAGGNGIHVQDGLDTVIKGNFVGLDRTGITALENVSRGIDVSADEGAAGTIGGDTSAERNFITGGSDAIRAGGNADNLSVKRNFIGLTSTGTQLADPPTSTGIEMFNVSNQDALISRNRIVGTFDAMDIAGSSARIVRNKIGLDKNGNDEDGPDAGIRLLVEDSTIGEPGAGNTIANTDFAGIRIQSASVANAGDNNTMQGNYIGVDSGGTPHPNAGWGILIGQGDPGSAVEGSLIGGDSSATENVISNSDRDAIAIFDPDAPPFSTGNQIKRNRGKDNGAVNTGDLFIDLGDDGPGNPGQNDGIDAPVLADAGPGDTTRSHTEGTCSGDTVYIFRTSNEGGDNPNRINAFVKQVPCGMTGTFSANFSQIPSGQSLTALALDTVDGSSELAEAVDPAGAP